MAEPREYRDGGAEQEADKGIDALELLGAGGFGIIVHKVLNPAIAPENTGFPLVVIRNLHHRVEPDGLAQSIHLGHFCGAAVITGQQSHGHLQAERRAAGHPQVPQAEHRVHAAADEGDGKQGIDGETTLEQVPQSVQHLMAAQQSGDQHGQNLTENHQPQPVLGNHVHGKQGGGSRAEQNNDQIQEHGGLQLADSQLGKLIVPLLRPGNQLLFQLPEPGFGVQLQDGGLGRLLLLGSHLGQIIQADGVLAGRSRLLLGRCLLGSLLLREFLQNPGKFLLRQFLRGFLPIPGRLQGRRLGERFPLPGFLGRLLRDSLFRGILVKFP